MKRFVFATFGLLAVSATLWALDERGKPTKTAPAVKPDQPPAVAPGFPGAPPGVAQPPQGGPPGGAPGGFQPPGGGPFPPGFGPPGGRTDYKELIPALIDTLGDPDADVRKNVVHALGHLGQSAVTPLLDILKDKDKSKEARANAAYALGKIGPQARAALPTLAKALKDHDRELRRRAAFAIAHILGGSPYGPYGSMPGGMAPPGGGGRASEAIADPGILLPGKSTKTGETIKDTGVKDPPPPKDKSEGKPKLQPK